MKRKLILFTLIVLTLCLAFVSCGGEKAVTKINIYEGLATVLDLNATPDYSAVKATVTYNDNTTKEVTGADLTFSTIDTSTPGDKTLTISYDGYSYSITIKVQGTSLDDGGNDDEVDEIGHEIMGAVLPNNLVAFGANAQRFEIKNATYKVGDANPFRFRLTLKILDDNDDEVSFVERYTSTSTVHLVEGSTQTLVGAEYVTVDETNNTFDFTAAAVGKTFVITTRPLYGVEGIEAECTKSLTVEVVAGYNVTNAKELNLMTNEVYEGITVAGNEKQYKLAKDFLDEQYYEGFYDTYGGDVLKGLVFHCDLAPTKDDIPAYYVEYAPGKIGFDDHTSIYQHQLTPTSPSFGMYGNYFTIRSTSLPYVADATSGYNDDGISSSEMFKIEASGVFMDTYEEMVNFDHSQYVATIDGLALRGSDANENNVENNELRKLGLIAFKLDSHTTNFYNTIIEGHNISVVMQYQSSTVNLDHCTFNNAWQGHFYVWLENTQQKDLGYTSETTFDFIDPLTLNIRNSSLTKCGGPVILTQLQTSEAGEHHNDKCRVDITVDEASTISALLTPNDAWFQAYGKVDLATQLLALDVPIQGNAAGFSKNLTDEEPTNDNYPYTYSATILTKQEGTGDQMFADMKLAAQPGGRVTYTVVGETNKVLVDNEGTLPAYYNANGMQNVPLFSSSAGGWASFNGDWQMVLPDHSSVLNPMEEQPIFDGDTLTLYFQGLSLLLGYYHPVAE